MLMGIQHFISPPNGVEQEKSCLFYSVVLMPQRLSIFAVLIVVQRYCMMPLFMAETVIRYGPLPRWQMSACPTSMGKRLCIMPSPHQTQTMSASSCIAWQMFVSEIIMGIRLLCWPAAVLLLLKRRKPNCPIYMSCIGTVLHMVNCPTWFENMADREKKLLTEKTKSMSHAWVMNKHNIMPSTISKFARNYVPLL